MSDFTLLLIVFFLMFLVVAILSRWRAKKDRNMLDIERWCMVKSRARNIADIIYLVFIAVLFIGNALFNTETLSFSWHDMGVIITCIISAHEVVECVALLIYDKKFKIIF